MPFVEITSVHLSGTQYQQANHVSGFLKFHTGVPYKKLSIMLESCKNQSNERHALLKRTNENLPVCSTYFIQFG
jgi:hypothetical protein